MLKKLIILILFLVFTVLAIGFVTIPDFGLATQFKMKEKAVELADAKTATVIDIPIAPAFIAEADVVQVVIVFDKAGIGYTEIIGGAYQENGTLAGGAYTQSEVIEKNFTYVNGAKVVMWLFALLMIILLPRKHGKKKIKKLARQVAEEVVDEEMDNMPPPQRYAPAPRSRGGEGRRRRDDYDDDYDY